MAQMSPDLSPSCRAAAFAAPRHAVLVALAGLIASLAACATEHVESRKECNHHCSVVFETCSERSFGGNTLNNCGYENMRCNALCPSR
jgi:hypothetical protein